MMVSEGGSRRVQTEMLVTVLATTRMCTATLPIH